MQVKFNATGTHIQKGLLKVRLDLYPDVYDGTYAKHYVQVPVIPGSGYTGAVDEMGKPLDQEAYQSWLDSLPHIWQLNPCLCHFLAVPETVTLDALNDYIGNKLFTPDNIASLDNALMQPNSVHLVGPFMRRINPLTDQQVQTKDIADLIGTVNARFAGLVIPLSSGEVKTIEPESIDIGAGAIDRVAGASVGCTIVDKTNPANAAGTIDTAQFYFGTNATSVRYGILYLVSGTTFHCRSAAAIGNVTAGSTQTFTGLSLLVQAGDFNAYYCATGNLDYVPSGGGGDWYILNNHCIDNDESVYSADDPDLQLSIYGTGTEGGGTAKTASDSGAGVDSRLSCLASLTRADTGGSSDGATGRGLVINDSGHGADAGMIPGLKSVFGGDGGTGYDALKALIGTSGVGSDMKLPGRLGQVRIPSKGVSL